MYVRLFLKLLFINLLQFSLGVFKMEYQLLFMQKEEKKKEKRKRKRKEKPTNCTQTLTT